MMDVLEVNAYSHVHSLMRISLIDIAEPMRVRMPSKKIQRRPRVFRIFWSCELMAVQKMRAWFIYRHEVSLVRVAAGGGARRERTPAQWKVLFSGAGFRLSRIVACRGPMAVVEAVPV